MALAEFLGKHGDGDGSRIWVGAKAITKHFGWSRATTFRLLEDLKELRLLEDEINKETGRRRLESEHGTRMRRMNLLAFLGEDVVGKSVENTHQESHIYEQESHVYVQESHKERETQPARTNRHLRETSPAAPAGFNSTEKAERDRKALEAELGRLGQENEVLFQVYAGATGDSLSRRDQHIATNSARIEQISRRLDAIGRFIGQTDLVRHPPMVPAEVLG